MKKIHEKYKPLAYAKCMSCGRKVHFENVELCHKVYDKSLCAKRDCQGLMVVFKMTDKEKQEYDRTHK